MDRQLPHARIELGDDDAGFQRHPGLARKDKFVLNDRRRTAASQLEVTGRKAVLEADVVRHRGVDARRVGGRSLVDAGDRLERLPFHLDQGPRILGLRPCFRDDGNDRLALPACLAARQRKLRRRDVALDRREPRLPWLADRGEVLGRDHRDDAGRGFRRVGIDRSDARMRMRAAQECDVGDIGHGDVVGVAAAAGDKTRHLAARDVASDPRIARRPGVRHGLSAQLGAYAVTMAGIMKISAIISMVSQTYGIAAR
jgi:hypothetical protein